MGACSCFSNSSLHEPTELSAEARTTLEKSLAKKSVQYLKTPLTALQLPEKYANFICSLPLFEFDKSYPEFANATRDNSIYRTNYNDLFQSHWNNGQPNGPGKILYDKDEFYYEGYIKSGEPFGKGRLVTKNLEVYEGEFKGDRLNLEGTYKDTEGLTLTGVFANGLVEGQGEEKWTNGTAFVGNYKKGAKNGKGTLVWENSNKAKEEKYEGEFKDNLFEGNGTYTWGTQKKYVGEWKKGMMDGEGVFTWKDGRVYRGSFKEDKKDGYGELEWSDGRLWKGTWKDDKQEGVGSLRNSSGEVQTGLWEEGKRIKWLTEQEAKEHN